MSKQSKKKKTASKKSTPSSTERLRKQTIADTTRNIARIDAQETDGAAASSAPGRKPKDSAKGKPSKRERRGGSGGSSGLDVAAKVLSQSKQPMTSKQIVEVMLKDGLWKTSGKTPQATIYSAMIREIAEKGKESRFKKVDRGMFTAKS